MREIIKAFWETFRYLLWANSNFWHTEIHWNLPVRMDIPGSGKNEIWSSQTLNPVDISPALMLHRIFSTTGKNSQTFSPWLLWLSEWVKSLSHVQLFATPWTVAQQAPPSMGFSRQEYWSGLPFPSPGDLPDPGIEPRSPTLQADSLPSEPPGKSDYYDYYG